jgi:tRNA/rRNA methyltransferase
MRGAIHALARGRGRVLAKLAAERAASSSREPPSGER